MAIFKCKICGGTLEIDGAQSVATCEYCGTKQTLPKLDDERHANLYDRANHFRRNNDFDKAMGIYENILNEDNTDAEAYWSIVLCRYGIEYVEDPATHKRIPTVNRAQFTSVFDDEDYKSALQYADGYQREIYEAEATAINEIQKGILAISQKEEPFDVFVCYKETDANGRRTQDSVLATELYHELTREGFKVFFSRITLEDKLGIAYEPYIFAALNSAKVMVVLGTRPEHFNAVWVKNEWSRYLALIKNGAKKTLIPAYRDMDPYDLPEEFSHLQAQDMSKLGFMQDLTRGIRKIVEADAPKTTVVTETVIAGGSVGIDPLFRRASMALEDGEFERADAFYEQILNQEPENAEAYVGKLLAELHLKKVSELATCAASFEGSANYKKALQFADAKLKTELSNSLQAVLVRIDNKKKEDVYQKALVLLKNAKDIPTCQTACKLFLSISDYQHAEQHANECQEKIQGFQKEWEQLRLAQRKKEEERRIAAKKTRKRLLVIGISLLLFAMLSLTAYISIFRVAIPNSHYQDAIQLIEEHQYDDAVDLLETAKEEALFAKTISKIEKAIDSAKTAKALAKAAEEAAKAIEQAITDATATIENSNYNKAVEELLASGVAVELVYQPNGGILLNDETTLDTTEFLYGTKDSFDQIFNSEKTGYRFVGWSCEKYEYQHSNQTFQMVLYANWSEKEYVIQYNLGGGTASNIGEYGVEDETFTLTAPKRTGYTFIGWTGTDLTEPTMTVTVPSGSHGDRTYTANWQANKYTVTLDAAGGTVSKREITVTYNSAFSLPSPYRGFAYGFLGWYYGNQKVESETWNFDGNITLVAKWMLLDFALTYDMGGVPATTNNPTSFTIESPTIILTDPYITDPSYEGCVFEGWYKDRNFTERVTSIPTGTGNGMILYAKWTIPTFTITYNWNGGNEVTSAKKTYTVLDLPISLPSPSKSDHEFLYWTDTDRNGDLITEITSCQDFCLYANYLINGMSFSEISGGGILGIRYDVLYTGDATSIEIPKYYFFDCFDGPLCREIDTINSIDSCANLETVIMPDSVTLLYHYAFMDCPKLTNVMLSANLEAIDSYAFVRCPALQNLSLPESILSISNYAFSGCDNLKFNRYGNADYLGNEQNPYLVLFRVTDATATTVTIPTDTKVLADYSFDTPQLTEITIPSGVTRIGKSAFRACSNLTRVVFENPNGWGYSNYFYMGDRIELSSDDLSKHVLSAIYLKNGYQKNYCNRYWARFETA
ncbi:MAG: InlB B-repeat-containing protein [Clostridia bacterium]|nr:InlB B-repeat-containing protein [Clostridia bacterium]